MSLSIRPERSGDIQGIHEVISSAFLHAPHTAHTEQFIVEALRDSGCLAISLVAEDSGGIIGHVALSPVTISDGPSSWYGLGPIAVLPDKQGKGVGSQLMNAALAELRNINANGCVLLGDPGFYHRFGFAPVAGLEPADVSAEYFLALVLQGVYPKGVVTYHDSFSAQG